MGGQVHDIALEERHKGWRLDRAVTDVMASLSRERIKGLISEGGLTQDGEPRRDPATKVKGTERFTLTVPEPRPHHAVPQDIPLDIVHEDDHLLVVNKPAGLVVHPAAGNPDGTLVNALLHHCAGKLSGIGGVARPGIVHRIDKDTSGLLVVAKTDKAHEGLAKQFAAHSIDRRYLAVASGMMLSGEGRIEASLARSPQNRKKMAVVPDGKGKHAVTHWRKLTNLKDAALIECRLETGRTHQVRVHLAHIGHALVGDPVYGRIKKTHRELLKQLDFSRQALHATRLGFIHPATGDRLSFERPLPSDMAELVDALGV
ncbi:RluA family pseudouridine synthase [Sphingomicrobium sediminis]|uniref:Pseudouridine synthase n=1 Tax=Sphingomicrobium sediminis TaxID=2950949 RepID=A0A9X2EFC3_9SPHN|nr:RluA family pseudouridine synthase [Sphingomicrobium sediminis]MCM8556935.1 RluA family pseudouridine synthase [Sphingomicrobium sediminis]